MLQTVHIEDIGSMHGTYVEDRKVVAHTRERLFSGDYIKFGAEVTRGPGTCWINDGPAPYCCSQPIRWPPLSAKGDFSHSLSESNPLPESFPPLEMCISFDWVGDRYAEFPFQSTVVNTFYSPRSIPDAPTISHTEISRNSFSVPDYDDDEDDEVEIIHESIRVPRVEVVVPPRVYTVPESDMSCAGSFTSDDSSPEPPTPSPNASRTAVATQKYLSDTIISKTSPADVIMMQTTARDREAALSDAPSAAGFFHSEGEQPSLYNQALGQPKPAVDRESRPTKTDSVFVHEDVFYDDDVTESDIESVDGGNGHSDDLFDDDGESIQEGSHNESPPPSEIDDSDDEPLASNRGTKLDHTDYRQELREHTMDENQRSSPCLVESHSVASPEHRPLLSDFFDSVFDPRNVVQSAGINTIDARAPSPSDAAMAKTSMGREPPRLEDVRPTGPQPTSVVPMTGDFPRLSTTQSPYPRPTCPAWPGTTSNLYSDYGINAYLPINSSRYTYQDGPFGYRNSGNLMYTDDSSDRGEEEVRAPQPITYQPPEQPFSNPWFQSHLSTTAMVPEGDQSAGVPSTTNPRATRLSLDDILEKNTQETSPPSGGQNLKRKADDISTEEDVISQGLALSSAEVITEPGLRCQPTESTQSAVSETIILPSTDAKPVAHAQILEVIEEPARKRAKTGVAKYAAAVFAGVVAGGVGTVAALLALPPIQLS